MHIINPKHTERELQIIKGTILGGSSLIKPKHGKSCYLSMREKNGKWLEYKASELRQFASNRPFTLEATYRWHSLCYPIFSDLKNLFYKNSKRYLTVETLDQLRLSDIAFMIWFGDTGRIEKNQVVFNTNIWDESGSQAIMEYFRLLGYDSNLAKTRGSYRVILERAASESILSMIGPHQPAFTS